MTSPAALYVPRHAPLPPQPETWWDYFNQHRWLHMAPQVYSWTCSICAATWVLQATGLDPSAAREQVAAEIGYPDCVNPSVGLADTQCLINLFSRYGVSALREWITWDRALDICASTTGVLNSTSWYHFVAIRGIASDGQLWIANSAPGYRGIWDTVSYGQFQQWAGSWQAVYLVP